jgi:hypothetical protein
MINEACLVLISTVIQVEHDRFPDSQSRSHEHASTVQVALSFRVHSTLRQPRDGDKSE